MNGTVKLLDDRNFAEEISSGVTLVDFFAEWCGPCKMLAPVIEQLASEAPQGVKIRKIDVDKATETAAKYDVMSIPTIIVFRDGRIIEKKIGLTGKSELLKMIQKACGN